MRRYLVALAGVLFTLTCTPAAFAGETNVRAGEATHPFTLSAHPMVSAPRPAPQPFITAPQPIPPEHTVTAAATPQKSPPPKRPGKTPAWLQNWQPNWLTYCQRWTTGPQGEWLNPYCYVPLFGLLGNLGVQSPFAAQPVFTPSSPF